MRKLCVVVALMSVACIEDEDKDTVVSQAVASLNPQAVSQSVDKWVKNMKYVGVSGANAVELAARVGQCVANLP